MKAVNDISQERAKFLFDYDPVTGDLIWRDRPESDFAHRRGYLNFLKQFAGKVAGGIDRHSGYRIVVVAKGKVSPAQRIIWIWNYGPIPDGMQVDHDDGNRTRNVLANLTLATPKQNMRNQKIRSTNTTGFMGVSPRDGKYVATILVDGKKKYLGSFAKAVDAAGAYKIAALEAGYSERHATGRAAKEQIAQ